MSASASPGVSNEQPMPTLPTRTHTENGRPILFYVKALYDYAATTDEEFDFKAGDGIAVTDTPEDGWWCGELEDETRRQAGRYVFPRNYVSIPRGTPPPLASGSTSSNGRPILFYVDALHDYSATNDKEFDFKTGDVIAVTDASKDGWWRGELVDEKRRQPGRDVFPSNFLSAPRSRLRVPSPLPMRTYTDDGRLILFHVKALYDYAATFDEELDFKVGDVISVTDAPADGWWSGELLDETRRVNGCDVFPSNFVSLL